MKILVVCQYYYPEPFRITDICEKLVKNGHDVTVLTGLPNYPEGIVKEEYRNSKKRNETINNVKVIRTFEIGRGKSTIRLVLNYLSFAISGSIKAMFLPKDIDVIYVYQLSPIFMALPAVVYKYLNHKKIVLYCLDLWPESLIVKSINRESIIYRLVLRLSKWIYLKSDKILVTSNMFKKYFKENLGLAIDNIDYLPQYAEDLFINETPSKDSLGDKKLNLVFAGNIGEAQSVETIILAANELKDNENFLFHIVGDGSKLKSCEDLVKKLNLTNVKFYGRLGVNRMPEIYEMADVMILTLKDDKHLSYTLPGKIQSYLAAGKPILGVISGEGLNVIQQAKCGFCCEPENYIKLSKLIHYIYLNKDDLQIYKKNAKKYYVENFSEEFFFKQLNSIFVNITN